MTPLGPSIFGNGSFQSIRGIPVRNGDPYSLNTIFIQGNAITHVQGSPQIVLVPNTIFIFNWFNATISNVIGNVTVGAALELDEGSVAGGAATNSGPVVRI